MIMNYIPGTALKCTMIFVNRYSLLLTNPDATNVWIIHLHQMVKKGHYFIPIQQNIPIFHPNISSQISWIIWCFSNNRSFFILQFTSDSPYSILGAEPPTSVETFSLTPRPVTQPPSSRGTHVFGNTRWSHSKLYVSNRTQWRRFWYLEPTKSHETSQGANRELPAVLTVLPCWLGNLRNWILFFWKKTTDKQ